MKNFLKWLLFPLAGFVLAGFYLFNVGNDFKAEEVKFEPRKYQANPLSGMEGVAEIDWQGKQVLSIKERAVFNFTFSQNRTLVLQLKYRLPSPSAKGGLTFFLNNTAISDVPLQPLTKGFDEYSVTIPFSLLRPQGNRLELVRSPAGSDPLYIESLKLRNFTGYSTGLLTAYILPYPLKFSLGERISWNAQWATYLFSMVFYSLMGLGYGFLLSRRLHLDFPQALGKGSLALPPSIILVGIGILMSWIVSGHLFLTVKSFLVLIAGLTLTAMAWQLNFIKPMIPFLIKRWQRIVHKKELVILSLTAGTLLSVLFLYSLKFDKQITGFMVIGDYFEAPHIWTSQTLIHRGSVGYDGQFYYYMAHDPFILGETHGHIDFPAYRYQRIVYPLTAWILALGQAKVIPYTMVAVNFLGILMGAYFLMIILRHYGRSPWFSLFYVTVWGFLLCLLRSLPEPLALSFVVMAVWAYLKHKPLWQGIGLTLAALTQETTLLVAMAFLFVHLQEKDRRTSLYMLFPFLGYLCWQGIIFFHFQTFSFLGGTQNFGPPLWGIIEKILSLGSKGLSSETLAELVYLPLILLLLVAAFFGVYKERDPLSLSFLGFALMAAFFNKLIWVEPWSYARATLGLLVFNLLIFTKEGKRINLFGLWLYPIVFLISLWSMNLF